jgi:hypothetical protein
MDSRSFIAMTNIAHFTCVVVRRADFASIIIVLLHQMIQGISRVVGKLGANCSLIDFHPENID